MSPAVPPDGLHPLRRSPRLYEQVRPAAGVLGRRRPPSGPLLGRLIIEIAGLVRESRIESLSRGGRPPRSLAGHRAIAEAIRAGDAPAAAAAVTAHIDLVSDVPLLADED